MEVTEVPGHGVTQADPVVHDLVEAAVPEVTQTVDLPDLLHDRLLDR